MLPIIHWWDCTYLVSGSESEKCDLRSCGSKEQCTVATPGLEDVLPQCSLGMILFRTKFTASRKQMLLYRVQNIFVISLKWLQLSFSLVSKRTCCYSEQVVVTTSQQGGQQDESCHNRVPCLHLRPFCPPYSLLHLLHCCLNIRDPAAEYEAHNATFDNRLLTSTTPFIELRTINIPIHKG